ncbi:hypothetical protein Tco_0978085 [Tanacetum coccineum]|uniref:Uncharacterized protein n=1 Tax=Tanacetum coccineum TaxID=301880 RepID=A0ABQ5ELY8_9ASTR
MEGATTKKFRLGKLRRSFELIFWSWVEIGKMELYEIEFRCLSSSVVGAGRLVNRLVGGSNPTWGRFENHRQAPVPIPSHGSVSRVYPQKRNPFALQHFGLRRCKRLYLYKKRVRREQGSSLPVCRMPQLHTSLALHLHVIVMITRLSRRDRLLNSQTFCRSIPAGAETVAVSAVLRRLWGSRNRRAIIWGGLLLLMLSAPQPLVHTTAPVAKSGHRGAKPSRRCRLSSLLDGWVLQSSSLLPLHSRANLRPARGNLCTPPLPFGRPTPHRITVYLSTGPWPVRPDKVQVVRIFTDMSISPSLSPRQCPDRYAFRAGRNLPDKEFRYLRTVIGVAPIHGLTGLCGDWVFGKLSPGPGHCDPLCEEATFSRSSAILPSYLESVSRAPRYSLPPNLCRVSGTGTLFVEGRSSFSGVWHWLLSAVAHGFGRSLSPVHFGARAPISELLRTTFMGAASRQTSAVSGTPTSFITEAVYLGALAGDRLAHSSTGTRSEPGAPPTAWELTVSCSISLPDGGSFHPSLTMFQLPGCLLPAHWIKQQFERLTYSGISESMLIFNLPERHFVALLRLPRLGCLGSSYRRTGNGELSPFSADSLALTPTRNRKRTNCNERSSTTELYPPSKWEHAMKESDDFFYSFPGAAGPSGLEPETPREVNHRSYGQPYWTRINRFLFGSDSSFPNAAYKLSLYCALQCAVPLLLNHGKSCDNNSDEKKKEGVKRPSWPNPRHSKILFQTCSHFESRDR